MLAPKKVKYRKKHKGRMKGFAWRGEKISFGDYGIIATTCGWVSAKQIEAGRIAIMRHLKKAGKLWIRIFPDKPITKKPIETRMGKGKGNVDQWVCVVKPGRILYEVQGVNEQMAKEALRRAATKLPVHTKFVGRESLV